MTLSSLYSYYASHKQSQWIIDSVSARILFNFVKKRDVKNILDLGTGIGATAAIASLAGKSVGREVVIDSVEQFDKCVTIANEIMPEELKPSVTIHKSETAVWETELLPLRHFTIYKELPAKEYDLIIVDGPSPYLDEKGNLINLPNGDVIRMLTQGLLKAGSFVIFDGRIPTLNILRGYFAPNFYALDAPSQVCNILEKKDVPFTFEDGLKVDLTKSGLFTP